MATNPVYQSSGILFSDMPKVQPYALQESIKSSQSLQNSLDRISEFAFKGAEKEAQRKGLQWGIDNPVTTEQIAEAVKMGINPGTLLPEAGTSFNDAARKVLAKNSRADLELKARSEITNIKLLSEIGSDIDMDTADAKLRGIIDGYSKVIGNLDPEEGASARASISSYAVDTRKQIGEQLVKLNQVENKMIVDEALSTYSDDALTKLELMDIKDPQKFSEELQPTKLAIINKARQTGPENYNKTIELIREKDKKVINTAIANHIAKQPNFGQAILDLDKGIAGDFTAFLKMEDKDTIVKMATDAASSKFTAMEKQDQLQNRVKEDKYRSIQNDFGSGKINGPEAYNQMKANGIHISNDEYKSLIYGQDETPANLSKFNEMSNMVEVDGLSVGAIQSAAKNRLITYKQAAQLNQRYFARTDDDRKASKIILTNLNIASENMIPRDKIIIAATAYRKYDAAKMYARSKGLPFSVSEAATQATATSVGESETPEYKEALDTIKNLQNKYGGFVYSEEGGFTSGNVDKQFRKLWRSKVEPDIADYDLGQFKKSLNNIKKHKDNLSSQAGILETPTPILEAK